MDLKVVRFFFFDITLLAAFREAVVVDVLSAHICVELVQDPVSLGHDMNSQAAKHGETFSEVVRLAPACRRI